MYIEGMQREFPEIFVTNIEIHVDEQDLAELIEELSVFVGNPPFPTWTTFANLSKLVKFSLLW